MYERSLIEAERILAAHKDVLVPVKEIWVEVTKQSQLQNFEAPGLADFTALLEGDNRFEFITAGEQLGDGYYEVEQEEDEFEPGMERLGFYSEDRVRLRNIEISEEAQEQLLREEVGESDDEQEDQPALRSESKPRVEPQSRRAAVRPHRNDAKHKRKLTAPKKRHTAASASKRRKKGRRP